MKPAPLPISLFLLICAAIALPGCAGRRPADNEVRPGQAARVSLYSSLDFDSHGRPVFSNVLDERPSDPGAEFYLIEEDRAGRPRRHYHVEVKSPEVPGNPLETVRDSTIKGAGAGTELAGSVVLGSGRMSGKDTAVSLSMSAAELAAGPAGGAVIGMVKAKDKGAGGGSEIALRLLRSVNPGNRDEAAAAISIAAASVAVGTAGGAAAGVAEGVYGLMAEASRPFSPGSEELISWALYEYDNTGRIRVMRAFDPGTPAVETFRVWYEYAGGSEAPERIRIVDIAR